jgi:hypothetical protein
MGVEMSVSREEAMPGNAPRDETETELSLVQAAQRDLAAFGPLYASNCRCHHGANHCQNSSPEQKNSSILMTATTWTVGTLGHTL